MVLKQDFLLVNKRQEAYTLYKRTGFGEDLSYMLSYYKEMRDLMVKTIYDKKRVPRVRNVTPLNEAGIKKSITI